ncbi:MAG TPA: methyltransferase domain-containing protein [Miltoncostaeaceae bacterium]|nr:methyltransferase domain-containing protein [Miltoncostaeaceae bacterium]
MTTTGGPRDGQDVGEGFTRAADDYDDLLRRNRDGARRLVASLPDGRYDDVLDVGCGTGFVTEAMVDRFATRRVTGVDPSEGMLERFREKLGGRVDATLQVAGVHDMDVPEGAFDAVVSGMAFHWFPEKPAAIAAMARPLRPGGALGILASASGTDAEFRAVLEGIRPPVPAEWTGVFDVIQRSADEVAGWMGDAGLDVIDAWEERRVRRQGPDAYLARIAAVASHLSASLDPEEAAAHVERVTRAVHGASGPDGFRFAFVKLFAIARRPA